MSSEILTIIDSIINKYNITLYNVTKGDIHCEADGEVCYLNRSCSTCDEIWLGIYDDDNIKIVSFFHEVGHIIDPIDWSVSTVDITMYDIEKWAWEIGFKLAEAYGITFDIYVKEWANKQLESYIDYNKNTYS